MANTEYSSFNQNGLTINADKAWYTGHRIEKIPEGLIKLIGTSCTSLDLSYNELSTISAIKNFTQLKELILDNNKLRDLHTLPFMSSITTLSLNKNKLIDIDYALEDIAIKCPNVQYVSLLGNPGYPDQLSNPNDYDEADYLRYRLYAIYCLPSSLQFLDYGPVTELERSNARDRGSFYRTVRLPSHSLMQTAVTRHIIDIMESSNYTPLQKTNLTLNHKGIFGKCRYRYSGKNSEGNKFIKNNDL